MRYMDQYSSNGLKRVNEGLVLEHVGQVTLALRQYGCTWEMHIREGLGEVRGGQGDDSSVDNVGFIPTVAMSMKVEIYMKVGIYTY